jgi:hypothetical protein
VRHDWVPVERYTTSVLIVLLSCGHRFSAWDGAPRTGFQRCFECAEYRHVQELQAPRFIRPQPSRGRVW